GSHRRLQRCEAGTGLRRLRLSVPADRLLERRALTIRPERRAKFPRRGPREQLLAPGEDSSSEHRGDPKKLAPARSVHRAPSRQLVKPESPRHEEYEKRASALRGCRRSAPTTVRGVVQQLRHAVTIYIFPAEEQRRGNERLVPEPGAPTRRRPIRCAAPERG